MPDLEEQISLRGESATTKQTFDEKLSTAQDSTMKYLHFLLAFPTAVSLATTAGAGSTETQLGPHSAQKFVLVAHAGRTFNENDPNFARNVALVLKIEQRMTKEGQEITASGIARKDGPTGSPFAVDNFRVHVTQPADFSTKPTKTAGANIIKTVPATGGKFKTVTAEASFDSPNFAKAYVNITVPGDK